MKARNIAKLITLTAICVVLLLAGCTTPPTPQPANEIPAAQPESTTAAQPDGSVEEETAVPTTCAGEDLSVSDAYELLGAEALPNNTVTAIDTRGPEYYATGHIPGAILISTVMPDFWEKMRELPRDGTYLVYCHRGSISGRVGYQMLKDEGFTNACNMSGGFNRWRNDGLPIEEGDA
ncbi:MAG: hypothetical protein KAQ74_02525 [Dehalococcoidia bacterium]|nr:hypothetical protein [Dehalococcoidia bacterium]